jgi:hypothetical protein
VKQFEDKDVLDVYKLTKRLEGKLDELIKSSGK